jgi:hypothetical protein
MNMKKFYKSALVAAMAIAFSAATATMKSDVSAENNAQDVWVKVENGVLTVNGAGCADVTYVFLNGPAGKGSACEDILVGNATGLVVVTVDGESHKTIAQ